MAGSSRGKEPTDDNDFAQFGDLVNMDEMEDAAEDLGESVNLEDKEGESSNMQEPSEHSEPGNLQDIKPFVHRPRDSILRGPFNDGQPAYTTLAQDAMSWWLCPDHCITPDDTQWNTGHIYGWCCFETKKQKEAIDPKYRSMYPRLNNDERIGFFANPPTTQYCLYRKNEQSNACGYNRVFHLPEGTTKEMVEQQCDPKYLKAQVALQKRTSIIKARRLYKDAALLGELKKASLTRAVTEIDKTFATEGWRATWFCPGCSIAVEDATPDLPAGWNAYLAYIKKNNKPKSNDRQYMLVDFDIAGQSLRRYCWVNSFGGGGATKRAYTGLKCTNPYFGHGLRVEKVSCMWVWGVTMPEFGLDEKGYSVCIKS